MISPPTRQMAPADAFGLCRVPQRRAAARSPTAARPTIYHISELCRRGPV